MATLLTFAQVENVTVDENFDVNNYSVEVDNALERGFDANQPIVVDEDGVIIDGNHRFTAFCAEGRESELVFVRVNFCDFNRLRSDLIDTNELDRFNSDNVFFYEKIFSIAA